MKHITFYSLSTCPICKKMKRFLDENGITYTQVEVDLLDSSEQWAASKELSRHNPSASYPTLVVVDVIIGFDINNLREKLL